MYIVLGPCVPKGHRYQRHMTGMTQCVEHPGLLSSVFLLRYTLLAYVDGQVSSDSHIGN
jgi:hypothetical protein